MQTITNQVSLALILLYSHERGELCNKTITAAATAPMYSIVDKDGLPIDVSDENYDGSDAYGIHTGSGTVYWANSVFNTEYIVWPDGITDPVKLLVIDQLEKSFLILK